MFKKTWGEIRFMGMFVKDAKLVDGGAEQWVGFEMGNWQDCLNRYVIFKRRFPGILSRWCEAPNFYFHKFSCFPTLSRHFKGLRNVKRVCNAFILVILVFSYQIPRKLCTETLFCKSKIKFLSSSHTLTSFLDFKKVLKLTFLENRPSNHGNLLQN